MSIHPTWNTIPQIISSSELKVWLSTCCSGEYYHSSKSFKNLLLHQKTIITFHVGKYCNQLTLHWYSITAVVWGLEYIPVHKMKWKGLRDFAKRCLPYLWPTHYDDTAAVCNELTTSGCSHSGLLCCGAAFASSTFDSTELCKGVKLSHILSWKQRHRQFLPDLTNLLIKIR